MCNSESLLCLTNDVVYVKSSKSALCPEVVILVEFEKNFCCSKTPAVAKLRLPDPSVCINLPELGAVLGNVKV